MSEDPSRPGEQALRLVRRLQLLVLTALALASLSAPVLRVDLDDQDEPTRHALLPAVGVLLELTPDDLGGTGGHPYSVGVALPLATWMLVGLLVLVPVGLLVGTTVTGGGWSRTLLGVRMVTGAVLCLLGPGCALVLAWLAEDLVGPSAGLWAPLLLGAGLLLGSRTTTGSTSTSG